MLRYPPLSSNRVVYAIGDVHGRSDLLDAVQSAIDADVVEPGTEAIEVYLGDYVDRGPDSKGVIDRLLHRSSRRRVVALRGNHEIMFRDFLLGRLPPGNWRKAGGWETLASYGIDVGGLAGRPTWHWIEAALHAIPAEHRRFLDALAPSFAVDGYFFTHAGIQPGIPLAEQNPDDLAWIRDRFLGDTRDHGAVVVHGHTPNAEPEFLPNRIGLDTAAYLTGRLTCLRLDANGAGILTLPRRPSPNDRRPWLARTEWTESGG